MVDDLVDLDSGPSCYVVTPEWVPTTFLRRTPRLRTRCLKQERLILVLLKKRTLLKADFKLSFTLYRPSALTTSGNQIYLVSSLDVNAAHVVRGKGSVNQAGISLIRTIFLIVINIIKTLLFLLLFLFLFLIIIVISSFPSLTRITNVLFILFFTLV